MGKKALVVSGGGSKGAFAVGVIKHLIENHPDINFDIYVGTSTGALIIPMVASGNLPQLERVYTSVQTEDIIQAGNIIERFRFSVAFYDTQPLADLIRTNMDDATCNNLLNSDKEVFIITTCLQKGSTVVWSTKNPIDEEITGLEMIRVNSPRELRRSILASSNQPVFMQPIKIKENEEFQYVDGGVKEYLGIQLAIDAGAEEIFAISLAPPSRDFVDTEYNKIFPILQRTIEILSVDVGSNDIRVPKVYNNSLRYIEAVKEKMRAAGVPENDIDNYFNIPVFSKFSGKKPVRIHHIAPDTALGGGPGGLEFDPAEMTAMLQRGINQMQDYMANLPNDPDGNV